MNKILTTQNAEITTAAVQVKTLTVTGKQVTLAVFRQLLEEPLINRDGSLRGIPWGRVNYHPDKCADHDPHWHVVWQDGTELRRARIYENAARFDGALDFNREFSGPDIDQQLDHQVLKYLEENNIDELKKLWDGKSPLTKILEFGPEPIKVRVFQTMRKVTACAAWLAMHSEIKIYKRYSYWRFENNCGVPDYVDDAANALQKHNCLKCDDEATTAEMYPFLLKWLTDRVDKNNPSDAYEFNQRIDAEIKAREGYLRTLATIPALPHLFIAV